MAVGRLLNMHLAWRAALVVGAVHLVLSLPFLAGVMSPSIHEDRYATSYVILNLPALVLIAGPSERAAHVLFGERLTTYERNVVTILGCTLVWTGLACACGAIVGAWQAQARSRRA